MAAEGTDVVGGGPLGGCLTKGSLLQAKCPDAAPSRRRGSARSRDAERRAYQWCREYLGGAWRQARPEELRVVNREKNLWTEKIEIRLQRIRIPG